MEEHEEQHISAKQKRKLQTDVVDEPEEDGKKKKKAKKGHTALPWMRVPAAFPPSKPVRVRDVAGIDSRLAHALHATGHSALFPVQAVAWEVLSGGMASKHDLCMDAPTGSGKTLAYALPVLQRCMCKPVGSGIQALVVVPTRVLAKQVFDVFQSLQAHLPHLHIVLANGSSSVSSELSQLSGSRTPDTSRSFGKLPLSEPSAASSKLRHRNTADVGNGHVVAEGHQNAQSSDSVPAEHQQRKPVTLLDMLPIDRKVFGHPHRNCNNINDLLKSVAAHHMQEQESVNTAALSLHGCSVWQWGHLKPQVVSVAVVTPGRLVHHLQELGHSWLANLEMLVVDEADRLLRQAYNEWLPVLNNALAKNGNDVSMHQGASDGALRGQFAAFARSTPSTKRLVKVLVSATLTKDPTKLAKMNLLFPRYISVDKPPPATAPHFSTPVEDATDLIAADDSKVTKKKSKRTKPEAAQLTSPAQTQTTPRVSIAPPAAATVAVVAAATSNPQPPAVHSVHSTQSAQQPSEVQTTMHEFQVVTAAHTKPHALLALLAELQTPECAVRAIVFASAVDAARRLTNLLEGSGEALGLRVFEMSSRVASRVQVETLAALQREPSWVLVASDNMTRGMDFPRVHTVINYDLPAHIRTYVHRAGRTARAGSTGSVYTILRSEHLGAFSAMMRRGGRKGILTHKIAPDVWNGMKDAARAALEYVQQQEAE